MLVKFRNKLGVLKNTKRVKASSEVIIGTNSKAVYQLIFENEYENYSATETIGLKKDKNGGIRIVGYHVSSDGFME